LALAGLTIEVNPALGSIENSESLRDHGRVRSEDDNEQEKPTHWTILDPFASSASAASVPVERLDPHHPATPIFSAVRRLSMRFGSLASEAESQCTQVASLNQLHSKVLGVIMRVCAYPVALIIVNILHSGESAVDEARAEIQYPISTL
jgi:hypothetical protein